MHFHLEIVMPPTGDIETSVEQIMAPFSEERTGDESNDHAFWDWYQIGGRWSGSKLEAKIGKAGMDAFHKAISDRHVTVSGLVWGKQTLQAAEQRSMVDALWRDMFPDSGTDVCPLFDHAPKSIAMDICKLSEMPEELNACHVIVASPAWKDDGTLAASYMVKDSVWNGVNYLDVQWDGRVRSAVDTYAEKVKGYRDGYREKHMPQDEWLVVTVDYHS